MNFKSSASCEGARRQRVVTGEAPSINMTPLVDIVFLLLIFFMVSTTFTKESRLQLNLPQANADAVLVDELQLEIIVPVSEHYIVNNLALVNDQADTLKMAMEKILKDNSQLPVIITADAAATHERVVRVLDVAGQLGLHNIRISPRQTGSTSD